MKSRSLAVAPSREPRNAVILLKSHSEAFGSCKFPERRPDNEIWILVRALSHDLLRVQFHFPCRGGVLGAPLCNGRPGKSNKTYLLVLRIAFGREVSGTSIVVTGLFRDGMKSRCLCPLAVQTIICRKQKGGMERSRRMRCCAHVRFRTPTSQRRAIQKTLKNRNVDPGDEITYAPALSSVKMSGLTRTLTAQRRSVSGPARLRGSLTTDGHCPGPQVTVRYLCYRISSKTARGATKHRIIKGAKPTHFGMIHMPHINEIPSPLSTIN